MKFQRENSFGYISVGKPTAIVLAKLFQVNCGNAPRVGYELQLLNDEKYVITLTNTGRGYAIRFFHKIYFPLVPEKRTNAQILEEIVNKKLSEIK